MNASKDQLINGIITSMSDSLSKNQLLILLDTLSNYFDEIEIKPKQTTLSSEVVNNYDLIKGYLVIKKVAGSADSTLKQYKYILVKFVDDTNCSLLRCDTNMIRVYLYNLQKRASNTTADNTRRYLNGLFQFLADEGYIEINPCKKIPKIKEEVKIKKFWDDLDIETLRDSCIDKRELALIDLLISTGLRISEVPRIKISDVDWTKRLILIHGKGNKERLVPMSVRAKKHLQEYIIEREYNSIYLFSRSREPYNSEPSKAMISDIFDGIRVRANLPDITIHGLRRWFASHLDKCGVDNNIIQDILGHDSFATTKRHYLDKKLTQMSYEHELHVV